MTITSIFEIDPETNEANGIVHPFCKNECLDGARSEIESEIGSRGFLPVDGEDDSDFHCEGVLCEGCGRPL